MEHLGRDRIARVCRVFVVRINHVDVWVALGQLLDEFANFHSAILPRRRPLRHHKSEPVRRRIHAAGSIDTGSLCSAKNFR